MLWDTHVVACIGRKITYVRIASSQAENRGTHGIRSVTEVVEDIRTVKRHVYSDI
jgi:hypothetical protein